jgi:hypothetical protein
MSIKNISQSLIASKDTNVDNDFTIDLADYQYVRPTQWLTLPTLSQITNRVVILNAIFPDANYVAFTITVTGGYTVDWGDGTSNSYASGVQATKLYNYSTIPDSATSTSTLFRGYKQCIISITPTVGNTNFATIILSNIHSSVGTATSYSSNYLDISVSAQNANQLEFSYTNAGTLRSAHNLLEQISIVNFKGGFYSIFRDLRNLQSIPVLYNTSISGMDCNNMFSGCSKLKMTPTFGDGGWIFNNTQSMFSGCSNLVYVHPLTNCVINQNASGMFNNCLSLQYMPTVKLTSCTNTSSMFANCQNILNYSYNYDLTTVTDTSNMFSNCYVLKYLPSLNLAAVTTTASMFSGCNSLKYINTINMPNNLNMTSMFYPCNNLVAINRLITPKATNWTTTFRECYSLKNINYIDTSAATNITQMFISCKAILVTPSMDFTKVVTATSAFSGCTSLKKVLPNVVNLPLATGAGSMFNTCTSLSKCPDVNLPVCSDLSSFFASCVSLQIAPNFTLRTTSGVSISSLFNLCQQLTSVPLFNTIGVTNFSNMFASCQYISIIPAFDTTNINNNTTIFSASGNLVRMDMPLRYTFTVATNKLSSAELDNIYTKLIANTGQTITVTGNFGVAFDTTSIATAKGWTVTG